MDGLGCFASVRKLPQADAGKIAQAGDWDGRDVVM